LGWRDWGAVGVGFGDDGKLRQEVRNLRRRRRRRRHRRRGRGLHRRGLAVVPSLPPLPTDGDGGLGAAVETARDKESSSSLSPSISLTHPPHPQAGHKETVLDGLLQKRKKTRHLPCLGF
jgi:hypothetical protein